MHFRDALENAWNRLDGDRDGIATPQDAMLLVRRIRSQATSSNNTNSPGGRAGAQTKGGWIPSSPSPTPQKSTYPQVAAAAQLLAAVGFGQSVTKAQFIRAFLLRSAMAPYQHPAIGSGTVSTANASSGTTAAATQAVTTPSMSLASWFQSALSCQVQADVEVLLAPI